MTDKKKKELLWKLLQAAEFARRARDIMEIAGTDYQHQSQGGKTMILTEKQKQLNALTDILNTVSGSFDALANIKGSLNENFKDCKDLGFDMVTVACLDGSKDDIAKSLKDLQDALNQLYLKANAAKGRIKYGTAE